MSNFAVGQVIVCVNGGNWSDDYMHLRRPRSGVVYTVRSVYVGAEEKPSVLLNEVVNDTREHLTINGVARTEPGFRASRFRPAQPTTLEAFDRLLAGYSSHPVGVP